MADDKLKYPVTVLPIEGEIYSLYEIGELTGIHPELVREFEKASLVTRVNDDSTGGPLFNEVALCRLKLVANLREREGLSLRMVRVFCRLIDQLERVEAEIRKIR